MSAKIPPGIARTHEHGPEGRRARGCQETRQLLEQFSQPEGAVGDSKILGGTKKGCAKRRSNFALAWGPRRVSAGRPNEGHDRQPHGVGQRRPAVGDFGQVGIVPLRHCGLVPHVAGRCFGLFPTFLRCLLRQALRSNQ